MLIKLFTRTQKFLIDLACNLVLKKHQIDKFVSDDQQLHGSLSRFGMKVKCVCVCVSEGVCFHRVWPIAKSQVKSVLFI